MVALPFNPRDVPENEFSPIPPGEYLCQVVSSVTKLTKSGNGTILLLTQQVMDGPYTGRLIFNNLNISNPSREAESISQRHLADLCLAVGVDPLVDTEELHHKPFIGRVGVRHDKTGAFPPQNTITYHPREGMEPVQQVQQPVQQVQQPVRLVQPRPTPTNGSTAKPWQKPQPRY